MIRLHNIYKYYNTRQGPKCILEDVNLTIMPGERIGILGRNGAGKSTMIRIVGGAEQGSSGFVERAMTSSWPLAFSGAFQNALTGLDNLRFICRIYDVDPHDKEQFVQDFSELGLYLREPVKNYSAGMRSRLGFAISMVIEFDCFLIDETISVGDARFRDRCHEELFVKRADRAMVLVSHDPGYIREHCQRAAVLSGGKLHHFATMDEAYDFYQAHPTE
jgi:capsular polysaccharide transport system ATP-binding protein